MYRGAVSIKLDCLNHQAETNSGKVSENAGLYHIGKLQHLASCMPFQVHLRFVFTRSRGLTGRNDGLKDSGRSDSEVFAAIHD